MPLEHTAILKFVASRRLDLLDRLVLAGARLPKENIWSGNLPLLVAAIIGRHCRLAEGLIEAGVDVNMVAFEYGWTALQAAASIGDEELVKLLVSVGAHVNARLAMINGRTALQAAVEVGHASIVEFLASRADVTAPAAACGGKTVVEAAVDAKDLRLAEMLILAGAPFTGNEAWRSGWTLLQAAADASRLLLIERLVQAGADDNAPAGHADRTALQAAAAAGSAEAVGLLLRVGADVNALPAEADGQTAL